ncbi:NAD(P)H dehydrogenase [Vallitalea okinawensis]|uniref:NAD(P)H dehydrogenase n=1 Tax=Vallitalea okinawensis TaxID=2078660 RepID=UPI000CFC2811|nr:NAD(P)H dehydrogenase [Vallitalea okinawensis]
MSTIILNGSPKGKKGNSEIFIQQFLKGMTSPCIVKYISKENPELLARYTQTFDTIIFVLPLYIHSMPGVMMRFIECLEPALASESKSIGFIVQCGFTESSQCKYVERYFCSLAEELNRNYLGCVVKGGAAATYMMPRVMTLGLFKSLQKLGKIYERTHSFDKQIIRKLEKPYELTGFTLKYLQFVIQIGADKIGWDKFLRDNGVLNKKLDRPFI